MNDHTLARLKEHAHALIIARRMEEQGKTESEEARLRLLSMLKTVQPDKDDQRFSVELDGEAYVIARSGEAFLIQESTKL